MRQKHLPRRAGVLPNLRSPVSYSKHAIPFWQHSSQHESILGTSRLSYSLPTVKCSDNRLDFRLTAPCSLIGPFSQFGSAVSASAKNVSCTLSASGQAL